jgi:hypothetical protein
MTAAEVMRDCFESGLVLNMDAQGRRVVKGKRLAVERLRPAIRENKPALLARIAANDQDATATRWIVQHRDGRRAEWDAPSGLSRGEAWELAERYGGPVSSLEASAIDLLQKSGIRIAESHAHRRQSETCA